MIICMAVDDRLGMMFNHRRQSQDKRLREHILSESKASRLWMNAYSKKQFEEAVAEHICVDEDFLDKAEEEDYCFVENLSLREYEAKIKRLILFKWNRVYPADMHLDIVLSEKNWKLQTIMDFEGHSHQKITKEIWEHEEAV